MPVKGGDGKDAGKKILVCKPVVFLRVSVLICERINNLPYNVMNSHMHLNRLSHVVDSNKVFHFL